MTQTPSISELLTLSNTEFTVVDVGRKIVEISRSQFEEIENNTVAYPYPSQGHAFLAIAFWQKNATSPYLWFIKLPLDENGLLVLASRDHFVSIIIEALGSDLSVDPTARQEELLKSNPYHFTPAQYKLAFINSTITQKLNQEASQFYPDVQKYLAGKSWDNWQNIGIQGLSDLVVRLSSDNNEALLEKSFKHLPEPVLLPICSALENIELSEALVNEIIFKIENNQLSSALSVALVRSLASSGKHAQVVNFFNNLLSNNEQLEDDLLIVIAGRCWTILQSPMLMMRYLELLANSDEQALFPAIYQDLVALPELRQVLLTALRAPTRSAALSQAIGLLFKQVKH